MALTKPNWATNTIQSLATRVKGQATTLKQAFDKAASDIKTYINDTLTVEIDTTLTDLQEQITSNDSDISALDTRLDTAESDIVTLETADAQNVKLTGNQTIVGVKTFSSSPIVPTPTTSTQAVNKTYADSTFATKTELQSAVLGNIPDGTLTGAKAYYFEVNGVATVTIEELQGGSWVAIATPTISPTLTSYTAYKGVLTPQSDTNKVRMKFSGTTHYRHINRCLFSYPFAASKIPDYQPWFKLTMPANFRTIDAVIEEYPERQYNNGINYKKEGFKDLRINYFFDGKFRVIYKPVPTTITDIDDVLEIDDITAQAVVYYIAARLAPFKNTDLVQFFEDKYMELKVESTQDAPVSVSDIIDVYGGGYNG